ncbi:IS4 family transposase, partial [Enterobacter cloacae]|uniref:IS4 family transposase n=1 Tax=Enterobacter cloacae TaxID=550 RepID=UPI0014329A3F
MPLQTVCQKFFSASLPDVHSFRINVLVSMAVALTHGADLTLTSLGRTLPGRAHVKNKIKRVDRALGNTALHRDIPRIQHLLTHTITSLMPFCVIAVDWTGWHDRNWYLLRASLVCNGRSLPLMSEVVPAELAQNSGVQCRFLDRLHDAIPKDKAVTIITDAGFRTDWFRHVSQLGWSFTGRVRGCISFRLDGDKKWMKISELEATGQPVCMGYGVLSRKPRTPCYIMALYSRRMQIEQNFRDDKSPRFGFGLRLSRSQGKGRLEVLNMVAAMASLVMWLAGYRAERQCLHWHYQASSIRHRRVLSYLSLAEEVIRHEPGKVRRLNIVNEMKKLGK